MLGSQQKTAYVTFRLEAVAPMLVHSFGVFADPTVNILHIIGFFGLAGDSVENLPPPIVRQTSMEIMTGPRTLRIPSPSEVDVFIPSCLQQHLCRSNKSGSRQKCQV
jgi:hypothetical protein